MFRPSLVRIAILFLLVVATPSMGLAERLFSPDEQAARRHFETGAALYEQSRYREAVEEFQKASALHKAPALDFNIGRCYERLEEWTAAADAFDRYLGAGVEVTDAATVAERSRVLRARATAEKKPAVATHSSAGITLSTQVIAFPAPGLVRGQQLRLAAIGVGVAAVGTAALGGGLIGSVGRDYKDREMACSAMRCNVDDLRSRLFSGQALLALSAVAIIADIALITVSARSPRRMEHAWVLPTGLGIAAGGAF